MHPLKIVSLGGFGKVTSNMFVYELDTDIIIVDCGMGFPTEDMHGIDILIPDISYLKDKLSKVRALILTHGHEDHTGALPYILPQLPAIPIYASRLPAHLVMDKLSEYHNMPKKVEILNPGEPLHVGSFVIESVRISHSIPDSTNLIIHTPAGTVYHGSDFKFDFTPVDGVQPDINRIALAGTEGVTLLLSDSLGSERPGHTPSEKTLADTFEREIADCQGKFIVTSMSSNISRWYQAATTAIRHGRRIAISGRSIERNLTIASKLGLFDIPRSAFVDLRSVRKLPPKNVCVLIAGSQAQTGSALERLATQDHRDLTLSPGDKVMFSSDYIPGNESSVQSLIDAISRMGAKVVYSEITDHLHVSGHGSQQDMLLLMALTKAQHVLPIGGTYRHMVQYANLAKSMNYPPEKILLPEHNQSILVSPDKVTIGPQVVVKNILVDGLGVGDVGSVVLRDRQHLAEEGVVVAVLEADQNDLSSLLNFELISRGFVFEKYSTNLLTQAGDQVKKAVGAKRGKIESDRHLRQLVIDTLGRFLFEKTHRRPMILPVVVEV